MQENPRYSLDELRLLLSQYLDGALNPDQLVEVELMLEQPEIQAELIKLQETKGLLHRTLQPEGNLQFSKVSDAIWKNIASQLAADSAAPKADYDFEFISAYYDGELDSDDPARASFEAQLLHNDQANRMLADVGMVSEAVRRFGYRLEEACDVDVTEQVMAAFREETGEAEPVPAAVEMISAFVDQALSPKEIIELNRLLEQDDSLKKCLSDFNRLSDAIRFLAEKLEAQAPGDFWQSIQEKLLEASEQTESGKVLSFPLRPRSTARALLRRVAIPSAAAAVLVLLSIPGLHSGNDFELAMHRDQVRLASVPLAAPGSGLIQASYHFAPPVQEVTQDDRWLVSGQESQVVTPGRVTPSSEEYLFQALEEQELDLSQLLGR
ncbi:MAG TPA: hypothetical protein V6C99_10010 [Oculatellaceae cyanobacterium]|jgi:anti-sigma factor RsiW